MSFDWTGFNPPLTTPQKTAAAYFENLGKQGGPGGPQFSDESPPQYTYAQAKAARAQLMEVHQRAEPAMRGVRKVLEYYEEKAKRDFINANP